MKNAKRITIRLPEPLVKQLDTKKEASECTTRSALIREALAQHVSDDLVSKLQRNIDSLLKSGSTPEDIKNYISGYAALQYKP